MKKNKSKKTVKPAVESTAEVTVLKVKKDQSTCEAKTIDMSEELQNIGKVEANMLCEGSVKPVARVTSLDSFKVSNHFKVLKSETEADEKEKREAPLAEVTVFPGREKKEKPQ